MPRCLLPLTAAAALKMCDFTFAENGLTACAACHHPSSSSPHSPSARRYKGEEDLGSQSFLGFVGEDNLTKIVDWTLRYIADLKIPKKRCGRARRHPPAPRSAPTPAA